MQWPTVPVDAIKCCTVHISCTGCTCPSVRCQNSWSIALALWFCPIERGPWLGSKQVLGRIQRLSWVRSCELTTGLAHTLAFVNLSQFAKHLDNIEAGVGLSWTVELSSELRSAICPPAFHFPRFVELHCIRRSSNQPFPLFSFLFLSNSKLNPSPLEEASKVLLLLELGLTNITSFIVHKKDVPCRGESFKSFHLEPFPFPATGKFMGGSAFFLSPPENKKQNLPFAL